MSTLQDRMKQFIETQSISVQKFERTCGLSNGAVSKMGNYIQPRTLERISHAYPILNISWLTTGEGEMIRDKMQAPIIDRVGDGVPGTQHETIIYNKVEGGEELVATCTKMLEMATALMSNATAIMNNAIQLNADMKNSIEDAKKLYGDLYQIQQDNETKTKEWLSGSISNIKNLREDIRAMIDNQTEETERNARENVDRITGSCKTINVDDIRDGMKQLLIYHNIEHGNAERGDA